ncbi:anthranilate synthase component I [Fictibacillus iocasae]|uniref:Anthranilate synthase component 1 n=1 Tax=Fictibacillus iocasae TaxID=2715437 RepID=A0ABW2NPE2_9BACL
MYIPDVKHVQQLSLEGFNVIPISYSFLSDSITSISIFSHFLNEDHAFLLESVEGGERWARYSYIGRRPFWKFTSKENEASIQDQNGNVRRLKGEPLLLLKEELARFRSPQIDGIPPFTGGAVGFFGYDLIHTFEKVSPHREDSLQLQDAEFLFTDEIIVFDHLKQTTTIIANLHVSEHASPEEIESNYHRICSAIMETYTEITKSSNVHQQNRQNDQDMTVNSTHTKEEFCEMVEKAKEYIRAGDIFQVVLSQRFEVETDVSPFDVYRMLRVMNPSPYLYYYKSGEKVVVGSSPELLVKVTDGVVENRPIAGTRPRGKTQEEDKQLERELLADEKETAEHVMLVDLGRNDVGRVSEYGSVEVESYMNIERYSHVMHIVSHVKGKLKKGLDFFDALKSCMPAGTVSGAPKVRALQIISELENEKRGLYAGAVGYLGFNGTMDSCIAIRTILFQDGKAYVQAGAGVVADSVPEKEYEETINKAMGMIKAIEAAHEYSRKAAAI